MKVKISRIIESMQSGAFQRLAEMQLPAKTAFRVVRIVKQCNEIVQNHDHVRSECFTRNGGTIDEKNNVWKFEKEEGRNNAAKEMAEFVNDEVEIIGEPFSLNAFASHASIMPVDLMVLDWLVYDKEAALEPSAEGAKSKSATE